MTITSLKYRASASLPQSMVLLQERLIVLFLMKKSHVAYLLKNRAAD